MARRAVLLPPFIADISVNDVSSDYYHLALAFVIFAFFTGCNPVLNLPHGFLHQVLVAAEKRINT